MLVDELVDNLRGEVNPNVKNSVFALAFKGIEKVLLDVGDDGMSPTEVKLVPLSISLSRADSLLADGTISQQMIDEFNRKNLDLGSLLETTHIDVIALRDIEEHTVDKEQERLNV